MDVIVENFEFSLQFPLYVFFLETMYTVYSIRTRLSDVCEEYNS